MPTEKCTNCHVSRQFSSFETLCQDCGASHFMTKGIMGMEYIERKYALSKELRTFLVTVLKMYKQKIWWNVPVAPLSDEQLFTFGVASLMGTRSNIVFNEHIEEIQQREKAGETYAMNTVIEADPLMEEIKALKQS